MREGRRVARVPTLTLRRLQALAEGRLHEYPVHLRQAVAEMPACASVCTFHGEDDGLPLSIGKSVNLRSRLLSHLRNPDETRMLRQTRRVSFIRTVGEIGALLLGTRTIKEQQLFNEKLRRNRQLCSWQPPSADFAPASASAPGCWVPCER